jgi:superfamily II DNA/RNA helicase
MLVSSILFVFTYEFNGIYTYSYSVEVKEKERQDTLEQGNITKKEVDLLLERKVNKLEFQQQIEGIMKSLKKHRKLVALSAGISDNVVDESQQPHMFTTTSMAIHGYI